MISSRTPEGEHGECPVCGLGVNLDPSLFYGDAPCPACGSLLWFVRLGSKNVLVKPTDEAKRKGLRYVLGKITGLTDEDMNDSEMLESLELDSVELVEMAYHGPQQWELRREA